MMTEAEAKNKWCPHVRFVIGPQSSTWQEAAFNNRAHMDGNVTCQGSGCMAWRWVCGEDGWSHVTPTGEKFCASTMESLKKAEAQGYIPLGYCGLAGQP